MPNNLIISPSVGIFASPTTDGAINAEWASYVLDALEAYTPLLDDSDEWQLLINRLINGSWGVNLPIGTISMIANDTAIPVKWLECNGQAVSRTIYAVLFSAIGGIYGSGDGTTTFNLPAFVGRVPMGRGTLAPEPKRDVGATVGASQHTLSVSEMPSHSHSATVNNTLGTSSAFARGNAASAGGTANTSSIGGGGAHNNLQPSLVVAFMIYAGV